jgi:DNA-binding NarL/FixJ family response regulator
MPTKRVLLADDNAVARSFVCQLFELQSDFEIAGEAENGPLNRQALLQRSGAALVI